MRRKLQKVYLGGKNINCSPIHQGKKSADLTCVLFLKPKIVIGIKVFPSD